MRDGQRDSGETVAMTAGHILTAFATIFPAELPDKTMLATIVLVGRYRRPLPVWIGAVTAFAVHVLIAVAFGKLLSRLPQRPVKIAVAAMFLIGAAFLLRSARATRSAVAPTGGSAGDAADEPADRAAARWSALRVVGGSFGLIILAEWGDLTQVVTAGMAARTGDPVSTGIGALAALAAVAAIAATFGRRLVARVAIHKINYVGAAVFAALGMWTLVELI